MLTTIANDDSAARDVCGSGNRIVALLVRSNAPLTVSVFDNMVVVSAAVNDDRHTEIEIGPENNFARKSRMGGRSGANTVENEIGYATTNKRKSVVTLNNDDTRPKVDRPNLYGELREEEENSIATGCRELRHREASQRGGRLMCTVHIRRPPL